MYDGSAKVLAFVWQFYVLIVCAYVYAEQSILILCLHSCCYIASLPHSRQDNVSVPSWLPSTGSQQIWR
jgi:hypothetical protein